MFTFTIAVILTIFTLDITLSVLNYKNRHAKIPENVSDIYDEKEYKKWLDYTMEGFRLTIFSKIFSTLLLLTFIFLDVFHIIADWSAGLNQNIVLQTLIFLAIYEGINYILTIGFSIYKTFSIEERYGFNKTTIKTFIGDQIKNTLLTVVLGGGLLFIILSLYVRFGSYSLIVAWLIVLLLTLLIQVLYTRVIIKWFNKLTPLEDGELKDKTIELARKLGYEVKTISVMDASKRTTKLNAFFSGFGRFKSIILYDNLVEKCTPDQVVSVLAHEIGHSINKDIVKGFFRSVALISVYIAILGVFLSSQSFAMAFGFEAVHYGFAIILFGIIIEPFGVLIRIPLSKLSRKAEYKADATAVNAGYKDAMKETLKILARENYANLTPHPLVVKMTYSHPPIHSRLKAIDKI